MAVTLQDDRIIYTVTTHEIEHAQAIRLIAVPCILPYSFIRWAYGEIESVHHKVD